MIACKSTVSTALSKLPTLLCLLKVSAYMPLLGDHINSNAWPASSQIILWNLQADLNKITLYNTLVYQEYKKQTSHTKEGSHYHNINTEEKLWLSSGIQYLCNKNVIHILVVIINILMVRNIIPCKVSGTGTLSFVHCLTSWSYKPAECCMQQENLDKFSDNIHQINSIISNYSDRKQLTKH